MESSQHASDASTEPPHMTAAQEIMDLAADETYLKTNHIDSSSWFAVPVGKDIGVFDDLIIAAASTKNIKGAFYRHFLDRKTALTFFNHYLTNACVIRLIEDDERLGRRLHPNEWVYRLPKRNEDETVAIAADFMKDSKITVPPEQAPYTIKDKNGATVYVFPETKDVKYEDTDAYYFETCGWHHEDSDFENIEDQEEAIMWKRLMGSEN